MKIALSLVVVGALAGCHGKSGGAKASQPVDVTQPPSVIPSSRPPFQIQNGNVTITPDADYSAGGVVEASGSGAFGGFGMSWGTGRVVVINVSDDANIVHAIGGMTKGQHVRVTGLRATMEGKGGKTLGPTKRDGNMDYVVVFTTELQIDDTIYTPASLPAGAK